jgi:hypothetical protein
MIGFSSAPFYLPTIECYIFDPTEKCATLMSKTSRLYFSEFLYGILMLIQGIIANILSDKIKSVKLAVYLNKSCKLGLIVYILCALLRISFYFAVHASIAEIDQAHQDKGFGSFFAEYVNNTTGSMVLTILLITIYFFFYMSLFWMIRQTNKMIDFNNAQTEEYHIGSTILRANDNAIESSSKRMGNGDINGSAPSSENTYDFNQ